MCLATNVRGFVDFVICSTFQDASTMIVLIVTGVSA